MSAPGTPRLVGRDEELALLVAAFDACRTERVGQCVVVHGAAGMGASAIARAVHGTLGDRGLAHHWWSGRCTRSAQLPYEPMAGLLRTVDGDAAAWLAEGTAAGSDLAGVALVAGLVRRIRAASEDRPLVVVVDDVDGADASTLRLLLQVVPLLDDVPVLVVLCGRTSDSGHAPAGLDAIADRVVAVTPLDPDDLAAMVGERTPIAHPNAVAAIVEAAAGQPALALALAAAGDTESTLSAVLASIDPSAAPLVVAASLADGWLGTDLLAELSGAEPALGADLARRGVLAEGDRGLVVSNDLWRSAATRAAGTAVRDIARTIAARLPDGAPASTVALAHEIAGDPVAAAAAWVRAADAAERAVAVETAAAALRRAIELGGDDVLRSVGFRAGDLSIASGDRVEADAIGARLAPLIPRTDPVALVRVGVLRYRARYEAGLGDADRHLVAALSVSAPPCRERVDALVIESLRIVLDDPTTATVHAAEAQAIAAELGDDAAVATAGGAAGLAAAIEGRLDEALGHFDRALAAAAAVGDGAAEARLASNRVYVLWRAGRYADVVEAADDELARLRVRGLEALGDQLAVGHASALLTLGRLAELDAALARARGMRFAADATALLDVVDAELALVRGDRPRAEALLAGIRASAAIDVPEVVADRWHLETKVALATGDRAAAADRALAGLRGCATADSISLTRLTLAWWRAVDPDVSPDSWPPALPRELVVPEPIGAESRALVAEIDAHQAARAERASLWTTAIAAWAAVPAPVEVVRCRAWEARDAGDLATLQVLVDEADANGWVGVAEQVATIWRALGGRRPVKRNVGLLTEREVEVLQCVAEGLTNREIAERLYISVKTVGTHLEKSMSKLGAATRGAAVHEARRQGLMA
jgi:DNA-binding CsgD family transcriptional regulator/tetratricopeptide (TPR) repeat protein